MVLISYCVGAYHLTHYEDTVLPLVLYDQQSTAYSALN